MFGLTRSKLPITEERRRWIDRSFVRLGGLLGVDRLLDAPLVLPTPDYFPDRYDGSEAALRAMFSRIASYMRVEPSEVEVALFATAEHLTSTLVPFYSGGSSGAAGLYEHDPSARAQIAVDESQMKDPMTLVATIAHELGHVILLRPGLVGRDEPDMEPLNDLVTIFLGFGIFTANSAFRFAQHQDGRSRGWSARRLGYLSEEDLGYALARFAYERGEMKPEWVSFLATNVKTFTKRSAAWLTQNSEPRLLS